MTSERDIPAFYSDSVDTWKQVIGDSLHYHFGHFLKGNESLEEGMSQAIRNYYRFIPKGSSVIDLGAGWGGPADMLSRELDCRVTCITNTPIQHDYILKRGMNSVLYDLEKGLPLKQEWHTAMMIESLCHIENQEQVLKQARERCKTLIIRMTCTRLEMKKEWLFGGTMVIPKSQTLLKRLENTGWKVKYIKDQAKYAWPSLVHWKKNLLQAFPDGIPEGQFSSLDRLCDLGLSRKDWWIWSSPLFDIVAT